MGRCGSTAAVALAVLLPVAARAGPPYVTDDPEPTPYRHWEVYVASQVAGERGAWSGTGPHVEANYGVLPEVQLHVIAPVAWTRAAGRTRFGFGDMELGIKVRFVKETATVPQIGTFDMFEVPTGTNGQGNGALQVFLPLWFQKSVGPWTTYGGGGVGFNDAKGGRNWGFAGWMAQYALPRWASIGAEVYGQSPRDAGSRGEVAFDVGAQVDLSDVHHLLVSVGRDLWGPVVFQAYLGWQATFGPAGAP